MNSRLYTVLLILCCVVVLLALSTIFVLRLLRPKTPQISFDNNQWHAGTIKDFHSNSIKHIFTFKNAGLKDLEILDIKSGCSCTVPELADLKKNYKSGESGKINITLTAHNPGPVKGTILVFSNSPTSPDVLEMGANYLPKTVAKSLPVKLSIKDFVPGFSEAAELNIAVISLEEQEIDVKEISSQMGAVSASVKKTYRSNTKSDRGYYNHCFQISVLPIAKTIGMFMDTLKISFTTDAKPIEVPVEVAIVDRWSCTPEKAILVWDGISKMKPKRKIIISDLMNEPFDLALVENPHPELLQIDFDAKTFGNSEKSITVACRSTLSEEIKRGVIVIRVTGTKHQNKLIEIPVTIMNPNL